MPIIEIEVSQAIYDALAKACDAKEHMMPSINPANPKQVIYGPKWESPEDLAAKTLDPIFAQIAGPYLAPDPSVNTLVAQREALAKQIADATKTVRTATMRTAR